MLVASLGMGVRLLGVGLKITTSTDSEFYSGRAPPSGSAHYFVGDLILFSKRDSYFRAAETLLLEDVDNSLRCEYFLDL